MRRQTDESCETQSNRLAVKGRYDDGTASFRPGLGHPNRPAARMQQIDVGFATHAQPSNHGQLLPHEGVHRQRDGQAFVGRR
jgi:hypothetical protein